MHYYYSNEHNYFLLCNVKLKYSVICRHYVSCFCYAYEYKNIVIKDVSTRVYVV